MNRVAEIELTAVVFENTLHYSQAKTRPLFTCGDVRFGQPVAVFFGQAYAVVLDLNDQFAVLLLHAGESISRDRLDRPPERT